MFLKRVPAVRLRNRKRRRFLIAFFIVLISVALVPAWVSFPPRYSAMPSDAVVVVAGLSDGRHQLGAELIEAGIAQNFVVSNPAGRSDKIGFAHCRGGDRPAAAAGVWCLRPNPVTTTGEALATAKLAETQGWSTLTVVTSRTHARRVHTIFARCSNLDVSVVPVDYLWNGKLRDRLLHEIGGYLKFWLTNPC